MAVRPAVATTGAPPSRYASIVIDADSGTVLYERNADLPRHPASLTKIMTLYLTFEALASKKLALTDEVTVSAFAAGRDPSRLDLAPGSRLKLEDAIRAMTTKSANDAACAIAEKLGGGSERKFAEAMTAKARTMGLTHSVFRNASGLPDDGHTSSARDMALLSKALIHDFPEQYRYFSLSSFKFHNTHYPNQNRFLRTYYGADGIKTGFINASGHNLAASAVRGGKRLIAIVLGGDTQAWTREHTTRLLDVSYAKLDPSLVMVASNETPPPAPEVAAAVAAVSTAAAPAVAATPAMYATPGGAVTVAAAAPALPLPMPNATANLVAYAAATKPPAEATATSGRFDVSASVSVDVGSTGPEPASVPAAAPAATESKKASNSAPASGQDRPTSLAAPAPAAAVAKPQPPPTPAASSSGSLTPSRIVEPPAAGREARAAVTEEEISKRLVARAAKPVPAAKPSPAPGAGAAAATASTAPAVAQQAEPAASTAPAAPVPPAPKPAATRSGAETAVPAQPAPAAAAPLAPEPDLVGEDATAEASASGWSVQVGLFRDATIARRRGEEARKQMPLNLRGADLVVGRALDGVHVTSRISRLSEQDAREACSQLQRGRVPCVVVPPGRPLVVATN